VTGADAHSLGLALEDWAQSPELQEDLRNDPLAADWYTGEWVVGGCFMFALAIAAWGGPRAVLVGVVPRSWPEPSHVLVRFGRWYFDATGARQRRDVIRTWTKRGGRLVEYDEIDLLEICAEAVPGRRHRRLRRQRKIRRLMAASLQRAVGPPSTWGIGV